MKIGKSGLKLVKISRNLMKLSQNFRNLISHNLPLVPGAETLKNEEKHEKQNPKKIQKFSKFWAIYSEIPLCVL